MGRSSKTNVAFGSYRRYDVDESILTVRTNPANPSPDINHQTNTTSAQRLAGQLQEQIQLCLAIQRTEPLLSPGRLISLSVQGSELAADRTCLYSAGACGPARFPITYCSTCESDTTRKSFLLAISSKGRGHRFQPARQNFYRPKLEPLHYAFSNPAWVFKTAAGASWYKGSLAGTHNFKFGFESGNNYNPYVISDQSGHQRPVRQWPGA